MRSRGRGVLVTGSSRGVGAAAARAFAVRGDRVVVHYRAAERAAAEVLADLPGEGHSLARADLADPDAGTRPGRHRRRGARAGGRARQQRRAVPRPRGCRRKPTRRPPRDRRGLRRMGAGLADDRRHEPARSGQPHLVRGAAHDRRTPDGRPAARPDRQRGLARRLSRRARRAGVRREQGRAARVRSVDGDRPCTTRHLCRLARTGLHRHRHGDGAARRSRGRRDPRPEPVRPGCDGRGGRHAPSSRSRIQRPSGSPGRSWTSTVPATCADCGPRSSSAGARRSGIEKHRPRSAHSVAPSTKQRSAT